MSDVQKQTLDSVEYALRAHGYSTAISKKEEFNFSFLQQYANRYKSPLLVLLRMSYPTGHDRQHLIGIVPIEVENETHMHIVEGCHPQKTMIPLNEKTLTWCSGECNSCIVNQFVMFLPGKNVIEILSYLNKSDGVYSRRVESTRILSESISSISQYTG